MFKNNENTREIVIITAIILTMCGVFVVIPMTIMEIAEKCKRKDRILPTWIFFKENFESHGEL